MNVRIEPSWGQALAGEFAKPYFAQLAGFIRSEKASGVTVYPRGSEIFNAFEMTPVDKVKVVILGQDPYHGPGQAHGLSFSVPDGVPLPPSLRNIFREIETDLGVTMSGTGNLTPWARQGVLLLNASLTVRAGQAGSHAGAGWEHFTDAVIRYLSDSRDGIVFLLWGNFARAKRALIDTGRHYVLEAAHPSPLARGAFFGCRHFSKTNGILVSLGKEPIDWRL